MLSEFAKNSIADAVDFAVSHDSDRIRNYARYDLDDPDGKKRAHIEDGIADSAKDILIDELCDRPYYHDEGDAVVAVVWSDAVVEEIEREVTRQVGTILGLCAEEDE